MADCRVGEADPGGVRSPAWVVGGGGLLGRSVTARLRSLNRDVRRVRVPWGGPAAPEALGSWAADLPHDAEVYWCAGSGVVGTSEDRLRDELTALKAFLGAWDAGADRATLFLASSAGGVYAGAVGAPFTERTAPVPLAAYGEAKLAAEQLAQQFAASTGSSLLIARFSNLYGPGQDFDKPQGLVSHLCRAHLTRTPLSIYVSADTRRDYLFVEDAADMVVQGLSAVRERGGSHLKIMASEQSASIAEIIGSLRRVTRRRPPVVFGASPNAHLQRLDLRFRSVTWPETRHAVRTPLPVGIAATLESVGRHLRAGGAGPT